MSSKVETPSGWNTVGPGYLIFKIGWPEEFKLPEAKFQIAGRETKIAMPDVDASGARDQEQIIKATVIRSGLAANRQTIEPFKPEVQEQLNFPLPIGTTMILRNVTRWKVGPNEFALQSCDYVRAFPPGLNPYDVMAQESEELKKVLAKAIAKGEGR